MNIAARAAAPNILPSVAAVYTISQLNRAVRAKLEDSFAQLWVVGEVSNFIAHNSGHWYFSLKDQHAQVRCVFFRANNRKTGIILRNGMQIKACAKISLYEGRGDFQLLLDDLQPLGDGALQQAFNELKLKLATAGWFDAEHKRAIPSYPSSIGIVTSITGAAIKDILSILKRRFSYAKVIIYPSLVQGAEAPAALIAAINRANQRAEADVLIITRGGGSLEDLWAFNNENLAAAIHNSTIPTISAVGHEIDFTIADFVADLRAPTPSGAAELATPDSTKLLAALQQEQRHLLQLLRNKLVPRQQELQLISKHLQQQHPKRKLLQQAQTVDQALYTLSNKQQELHQYYRNTIANYYARLINNKPYHKILQHWHTLNHFLERYQQASSNLLHRYQLSLSKASATIDSMNPKHTLARGYALVTQQDSPKLITSVHAVQANDSITITLQDGSIHCKVITINEN